MKQIAVSGIVQVELWHLNNININTFCAAWRTGLTRICTTELKPRPKVKSKPSQWLK